MKKSDQERLKKIVSIWEEVQTQILDKDISREALLSDRKLHQLGAEMIEEDFDESLYQTGAEMRFPVIFGYVPWRHHVEIVTKCNSVEEALFYIHHTIQENWSRNTLLNQLKADLYHKSGNAITNFSSQLPASRCRRLDPSHSDHKEVSI